MLKQITFAFILSFIINFSYGKINFIQVDTKAQWEEVLSVAKNNDKIIFAEIYADWCEPCQELDAKTFLDKDLYTYFNENLIAVKISAEKEFGIEFIEKKEIKNVPVLYFLDPAGNIISEEIRGYRTALKLLEGAKYYNEQYVKLIELKESYYSINRDDNVSLSYAFMLLHLNYNTEAKVIAGQYFRNLELFSYSPEEWTLIKQYLNDVSDPTVLKVVRESDAYIAVNGKEEVGKYLSELFRYNYALAIQNRDLKQLENTLFLVEKIDFTEAGLLYLTKSQIADFFRISYFERVNDWQAYAAKVVDYNANNQIDDKDLRNFIQNFYLHVEDAAMMTIADSWASKLLKNEKIFENYVMYCLTQHKTGAKSKAFKLLKKAEKKAVTGDDHQIVENIKQQFGMDLME